MIHRICALAVLATSLGACTKTGDGDAGVIETPVCGCPVQADGDGVGGLCVTCAFGEICDKTPACVTPQYAVGDAGTVTDSVTGLVWQQGVPSAPCPSDNADGYCTAQDAASYCQSLSLGGLSSWRLPTLYELYTLVDNNSDVQNNGEGVAIDTTAFPNTPAGSAFFTSTANSAESYAGCATYDFIQFNGLGAIDGCPNPSLENQLGLTNCCNNPPCSCGIPTAIRCVH